MVLHDEQRCTITEWPSYSSSRMILDGRQPRHATFLQRQTRNVGRVSTAVAIVATQAEVTA